MMLLGVSIMTEASEIERSHSLPDTLSREPASALSQPITPVFNTNLPLERNLLTATSQVEILQLENNLAAARQRLGEMRKISYQE